MKHKLIFKILSLVRPPQKAIAKKKDIITYIYACVCVYIYIYIFSHPKLSGISQLCQTQDQGSIS